MVINSAKSKVTFTVGVFIYYVKKFFPIEKVNYPRFVTYDPDNGPLIWFDQVRGVIVLFKDRRWGFHADVIPPESGFGIIVTTESNIIEVQ